MITDTHTHIFDEDTYKSYFVKANDKIDKVLTIYYKVTTNKKEGIEKVDLEDLINFAQSKDNLYVIGSVDVDDDINKQLESLQQLFEEKKIFGIKLYPGYQHFYPSDEKIYPIAELCQKYNKPLIFHSGDVYDFEGKAVLKYSHPIHIDGLAVKFPKCKMVIAHFGFPYHMEAANVVSKNENVYTEISGTIDKPDTNKDAENLLSQYAKDLQRVFNYFPNVKSKTMFGTDYGGEYTPLNQIEPYIELVERVFSKNEQENLFNKLAEGLFFR